MDTAMVQSRKAEVENEFKALQTNLQKLVEERKVLDQRISVINKRQVQLQGAYQELTQLLGDQPKEVPTENGETPKVDTVTKSDTKSDKKK